MNRSHPSCREQGTGANRRWGIPRESQGDKPEDQISWWAVNCRTTPQILNSILDTALLFSLGGFVTHFTQTITQEVGLQTRRSGGGQGL